MDSSSIGMEKEFKGEVIRVKSSIKKNMHKGITDVMIHIRDDGIFKIECKVKTIWLKEYDKDSKELRYHNGHIINKEFIRMLIELNPKLSALLTQLAMEESL